MKFESFDKLYLVIQMTYPKCKDDPNYEDWEVDAYTKFSIEGIYFDRDEAESFAIDECDTTPIDSGLYGVVEVKLQNGALMLPDLSTYPDCWQDFEVDSRYINTYLPALEEDE